MEDERKSDDQTELTSNEKSCKEDEKKNELIRENGQIVEWKDLTMVHEDISLAHKIDIENRLIPNEIQEFEFKSYEGEVSKIEEEPKSDVIKESLNDSPVICRAKKNSNSQTDNSKSEDDDIFEDTKDDKLDEPNSVNKTVDEEDPVFSDSIKSIKTMFKRLFRIKLDPVKTVSSNYSSVSSCVECSEDVEGRSQPSTTSSTSSFPLTPSTPSTPITTLECDLWKAARNGDVSEIQRLVSAGADVVACDREGFSALHWTTERGHVAAASALLSAGADANCRDVYGCTALHYAAAFGHAPFVQLLLDNAVDVNCRNHTESTALNGAVRNKNEEVVRLLRAAGAEEHTQE